MVVRATLLQNQTHSNKSFIGAYILGGIIDRPKGTDSCAARPFHRWVLVNYSVIGVFVSPFDKQLMAQLACDGVFANTPPIQSWRWI
jgi:hypothetical protein